MAVVSLNEVRLGPLGTPRDLAIAADILARKENEIIRALVDVTAQRLSYEDLIEKPAILSSEAIEKLIISKIQGIVVQGAKGDKGDIGPQGPPGTPGVALSEVSTLLEDYLPLAGGSLTGDLDVQGSLSVSGSISGSLPYSSLSGVPATFAPSAHTHVVGNVLGFDEAVDDRIASLLIAGTGVGLSYNDVANTLTISASGGGGLTEAAADARYLQLTGGTLAGPLGVGRDMSSSGYGMTVAARMAITPLFVDPAYAPTTTWFVYNSSSPSDITARLKIGVARSANEGVTGTAIDDAYITPFGNRIFIEPLRLEGGTGSVGINIAPSSEALAVKATSEYHTTLALRARSGVAPETYVYALYGHTGALINYIDSNYKWTHQRGGVKHAWTYGTVFESMAPDYGNFRINKPNFPVSAPSALGSLVGTFNVYDDTDTLIGRVPIYS
jgi:hypothetical protein